MKLKSLLCLFLIVPMLFLSACNNHDKEIISILDKYEKNSQYVIEDLDAKLMFNDHTLDLYSLVNDCEFSRTYFFINSSFVYFYGTQEVDDKCYVKLFKCDHYGLNFSTIWEKAYVKGSVNDYEELFGGSVVGHQDCALYGYTLYIKHHSGKTEDKNLYAVDTYDIESSKFKTILNGEDAYNFQIEPDFYTPPQKISNVSITEDLVFKNKLASELKNYGFSYSKEAFYKNGEIYVICSIFTLSELFSIYFRYNEQTQELEYLTYTTDGGDNTTDIFKINPKES